MEDKVSVITPAYFAEKCLAHTIDSVLAQTYKNWEMIIINDASTDGTKDTIEFYSKKDSRIRGIHLEKNAGVAHARNVGIQNASGDYIAFLDSDDLWHPTKIEKQLKFMIKNNYKFSFTEYEWINEEGELLHKVISVPDEVSYKDLLYQGNPIGCLTVMGKSVIFKKNYFEKLRHEDYALWLDITKNGTMAYGLNENLALYRKSRNSLSGNKFKMLSWTWNIYRNHQKLGFIQSCICEVRYIIYTAMKYMRK